MVPMCIKLSAPTYQFNVFAGHLKLESQSNSKSQCDDTVFNSLLFQCLQLRIPRHVNIVNGASANLGA